MLVTDISVIGLFCLLPLSVLIFIFLLFFFFCLCFCFMFFFFFSSRRRHTRCLSDWSSDVCSSDLQKLLAALALVVRSLHTPEKILGPVKKLAVKHVDYGVRPEHYTYVGNALLRTLKKGFGREFTPELSDAWVEAFRMLAKVMKEAAYGSSAIRVK